MLSGVKSCYSRLTMPDNQKTPRELSYTPLSSDAMAEMPQFTTVEYADTPSSEHCRICSNLISGDYFRVNGMMACSSCANQALAGQPSDSHAAFLRGLLVGSGGAVLGTILYSVVAIVTGWTIGYLGLAAGWLVGKGMMKGSSGLGGRRYQVAAVLLTYASISFSAIPVGIAQYEKSEHRATASPTSRIDSSESGASSGTENGRPGKNLAVLAGTLILWGLASPFLEFTANVGSAAIGLFILFLGLRIAWTLTSARRLAVDGPYSESAP
jgi:hypothetical protein